MKYEMMKLEAMIPKSRPHGARGLKLNKVKKRTPVGVVAPARGAWIEIEETLANYGALAVAPARGAWIEIMFAPILTKINQSRARTGRVD